MLNKLEKTVLDQAANNPEGALILLSELSLEDTKRREFAEQMVELGIFNIVANARDAMRVALSKSAFHIRREVALAGQE